MLLYGWDTTAQDVHPFRMLPRALQQQQGKHERRGKRRGKRKGQTIQSFLHGVANKLDTHNASALKNSKQWRSARQGAIQYSAVTVRLYSTLLKIDPVPAIHHHPTTQEQHDSYLSRRVTIPTYMPLRETASSLPAA